MARLPVPSLILLMLLTGCSDGGVSKDPARPDPSPEDGGDTGSDPCAGQPDGNVLEEGVPGDCGGFIHACDPEGIQVAEDLVCQEGQPETVLREEPCTREVSGDDGCVVWEGDLTINSDEDIEALQGYTAISGNLVIDGLHSDGLGSIRYIGGSFGFGARPLSTLSGFTGVEAVEGDFTLFCVSGSDLSMFSRLEAIGGDLALIGGSEIQTFDLPALHTLNGELQLKQGSEESCSSSVLTLVSLSQLGPFGGLSSLGALSISHTHVLEDLSGLDGLLRIEGDVLFRDNREISTCEIEDFAEAVEIGGELTSEYNAGCR